MPVATARSVGSSTASADWIHPRDVKSAIATVRQKKISASAACAVETGVGQEVENGNAAEHALRDHRQQRDDAKLLHPSAAGRRATARLPG